MTNTLHYGDIRDILSQYTGDESVDQVCSDPPFNWNASVAEREKAALGLFITLEEPTRDMRTEAVSAGFYHSDVWQRDFPKVQIRMVAELLDGRAFDLPPHPSMYQPAQRVERTEGRQAGLEEAG